MNQTQVLELIVGVFGGAAVVLVASTAVSLYFVRRKAERNRQRREHVRA